MTKDHLSSMELVDAFQKLQKQLNDSSNGGTAFPDIFIVFDEAHPLTEPFDPSSSSSSSNFAELWRALRLFSKMPLFTFFLFTTGKISLLNPPRGRDPSNRVNHGKLKTPCPFIYLGFDQLMGSCKVFDKYRTLEDVTLLDCIAHMGRPL